MLKIPLYGRADGTQTICLGYWSGGKCKGAKTSEHGYTEVRAEGNLHLRLSIDPNYTVNVSTEASIELQNRPHLKIDLFGNLIRINIDITDKIQGILNSQVPKIAKMAQEEINKKLAELRLRDRIDEYWKKVRAPLSAGDVWVSFIPEKIIFRGFHSNPKGKDLKIGLGFLGTVRVSFTKPVPSDAPLPPIETTEITDSFFKAIIPLHSTFNDLERELNDKVVGQRFDQDDNYIEVQQVRLSGVTFEDRPALLISVKFEGGSQGNWYDWLLNSVEGTLYFVAVPAYDSANRVVFVQDFQLTSDTSSAILDAGIPWLIQLNYDAIRNNVRYELGPLIDKLQREVGERATGRGRRRASDSDWFTRWERFRRFLYRRQ